MSLSEWVHTAEGERFKLTPSQESIGGQQRPAGRGAEGLKTESKGTLKEDCLEHNKWIESQGDEPPLARLEQHAKGPAILPKGNNGDKISGDNWGQLQKPTWSKSPAGSPSRNMPQLAGRLYLHYSCAKTPYDRDWASKE